MRGRCAEYALTRLVICSLLGMSLDWAAMAARPGQENHQRLEVTGEARVMDGGHLRVIVNGTGVAASVLGRGVGSHRPRTRRDAPCCPPTAHHRLPQDPAGLCSPSARRIAQNFARISPRHVPPSARIDAVSSIPIGSSLPMCMTLHPRPHFNLQAPFHPTV